jgi:hypothetical protein
MILTPFAEGGMDWKGVITSVGGATAAIGAVAWIVRSLLSQVLSRELEAYKQILLKDLESHKQNLKAEADRELAHLSTRLQIAAARERTRFDLLHQRRAEVVAKVYSLTFKVHRAARSFTRPMEWSNEPSKQEKFKELGEVGNELGVYFGENRIYFPEGTCISFDDFYKKIQIATQAMYDDLNPAAPRKTDAWSEAWKTVSQDVPPMLAKLEAQFREILGAEQERGETT